MNQNKKSNRSISPMGQNNFSPDMVSKCKSSLYQVNANAKNYADVTAAESYLYPTRNNMDYTESPDYVGRRKKDEDHYWNLSIAEINLELDNNMNEMIFLLGKRRNLVQVKKRKLIEEMEERLEKAKNLNQINQFDYLNDEEFLKVTSFCQNPRIAIKMLGKIMQTIPEIKGPRTDEEQRSQQFWSKNRKLQHEIDVILQKLKIIDKNLQKENGEVHEICRELDRIQDTLKSFVGAKSQDHVQKVEPLFNSKKKNYDILNRKIKDRQISKDKKIEYIKKIKGILEELKITRQERLNEIAQFFGLQNLWEFDKINLKQQGDFTNGIEELLKIKEKDGHLQLAEREVINQIEFLQKEQEKLYSELLRKQSDEAKAFHNYNSVLSQRIKYASMLSIVGAESEGFNILQLDTKEISRNFKEHKQFFKRFLDEDNLLKQGLVKTSQTSKTFTSLLRATQNQRERRQELLCLLQTCIKKRGQYEVKREEMRNIQFQQSRNGQELTQFQEDLEAILTDGDLDGYKKIGNAIGKCEHQKIRLLQVRELLEKQMQSMDRQVLSLANRIQQEYEDILCDILPSDYEWSLKTGEDVKKLRNHLRKMYKRLGILGNQ